MEKYLCMSKHLFPCIEEDDWEEDGTPIMASSPLGAAIEFVREGPDEAGLELLGYNQGETLPIMIKRVSTGDIVEVSVNIRATYAIVSASVISDRRREINAPV